MPQSHVTVHRTGTIFAPLSLISEQETAGGTKVRLQEGLPYDEKYETVGCRSQLYSVF